MLHDGAIFYQGFSQEFGGRVALDGHFSGPRGVWDQMKEEFREDYGRFTDKKSLKILFRLILTLQSPCLSLKNKTENSGDNAKR